MAKMTAVKVYADINDNTNHCQCASRIKAILVNYTSLSSHQRILSIKKTFYDMIPNQL